MIRRSIFFLLCLFTVLKFCRFAFALCDSTDCSNPDDCQRKIEECGGILSAYSPAQNQNKQDLANLERQVANTEQLLKSAESQQKKLEKSIFDREVDLGYQEEVFAARVRHYYIRSQLFSPFLVLLAADNAALLTRELSYRNTMANEDKKVIQKLSVDLSNLQKDKDKLEQNQNLLAQTRATLAKQAGFLRVEVQKVDDYLGSVSGKIASLTAKQQSLLAEKTGTFQTTVGEVPLADDPASRPDFNPGFSPAFAAFSFGAPHRKGMSQYGAWGRAKSGQSAEDILRAYYPGTEIKKDYSTSINITVRGYGVVDIETYVKRIYEVPSSWTDNDSAALKAQAVAARSYALAYTNNGSGSICATESCQVYKPANKGGAWDAAVEATRGWVLISGGKPFSAWYAASSGGYNTPSGWDTKCGNQNCWTNDAFEKIAGSPWFYKAWYKSRSGTTCGRSHPWLNQEEMADILNAVVVYRSGSGADRILPVDYNSCFGAGGSPWSREEMRQQAEGRGGAISEVGGITVSYGTNGNTSKIVFSTNRGSFEVGGEEFYTVFNLRAPGRISLKSKLFNLEKK
ncbi:MAG: SpoIID/LytB domain-containing protein [Candidatus Shapirobacteria bacterium]